MTPAVDPKTMRVHKRSRFEQFCDLHAQGENPYAIAARLKVTDRTIWRYLRDLEGPRSKYRYPQLMPRVLEHLKRYPDSEFTSGELARVLGVAYPGSDAGYNGTKLKPTLRKMEEEGLIVSEERPYNSRGYRTENRLTVWYWLAPEHRP
ncbi:hypothetical protein SAMN05421874_128108 [Nonomuraea maritima]|uniref:Helix-turn-helix domain-containing protein n=1 Tax=Nonomuraea maritima TaxID=683260 RepID=A0A1G9MPK8_9ACTN|nr:hypothetical protein [Nonomuraea maritima]SDL75585.1 hypothetical protein SAMN05421874_128108 [Nonomuraea maritima]